jgi:methionyl-tRNA formyltransferase
MGKKPAVLLAQLHEFYGTVDLARMLMRYAGIKLMGMTLGKVSRRHPYTLEQIFAAHGIDVIHSRNVNSRKLYERLTSIGPELIVSVAAPQVFKPRLLSVPTVACINIHSAPLPKYRGMMPNFWAMYHGERHSAITVHTMDAEIDRGEILLQKPFELVRGESLDALIKRTKVLAARALIEVLGGIRRTGHLVPQPVPSHEPSYFSFPTREHVRKFRADGNRLL